MPAATFSGEEGAGPGPSREALVHLAKVLFSTDPIWKEEVDAKLASRSDAVGPRGGIARPEPARDAAIERVVLQGTWSGHPETDYLLWALPLFRLSPDGRHLIPIPSDPIPWGEPVPRSPQRWSLSEPPPRGRGLQVGPRVKSRIAYPYMKLGLHIRQRLFWVAGQLLGMAVLSRQSVGVSLPQLMLDYLRVPTGESSSGLLVGSIEAANAARKQ